MPSSISNSTSLAHAALAGQQPGVGDVEQVVARDADPHGGRVLGPQRVVEAAQVVRVGVELGVVGRERPVVHHGVHPLHREVRALDQADLDARAARGDALLRPRGELLRAPAARRAGRPAARCPLRAPAAAGPPGCRVNTAIVRSRSRYSSMSRLMNVRSDARCQVQRQQSLDDLVDDLVERPHRDVARDRRDLDRHVVHVGAADELVDAVEPAQRLLLAEHRLAEQVEVEPRAALADLRDRRAELVGARVDDEVARPSRAARAARSARPARAGRGATAPPTCTAPRRYQGRNPGTSGATRLRLDAAADRLSGRITPSTKPIVNGSPLGSFSTPASRSAAGSTSTSALSATHRCASTTARAARSSPDAVRSVSP